MNREKALKIVLVVVGLFFTATVIRVVQVLWQSHQADAEPMLFSLYVTLGILLLAAARNPAEHRSLIAFTAWSSLAHASVMFIQSFRDAAERVHLGSGSAVFAVIGIALLALAPGKPSRELKSAAAL
jgi:Family of unknown function (DUF6632)